MTRLYMYDDSVARGFEPFALTRPVCELRAGTELIRARWARRLQADSGGFVGAAHLVDFDEEGAAHSVPADAELPAGSVIANSRCVVSLRAADADQGARAWICDGRVAAVRLATAVPVSSLADGRTTLEQLAGAPRVSRSDSGKSVPLTPGSGAGIAEMEGRWLDATWDLIATLPAQLSEDIPALAGTLTIHNPEGVQVTGEHPVFCERGAVLEPWVVLDAAAGPILIRHGATISAFSRIVGPCYLGPGTTMIGDRIASCSIGDMCKVRGEIANSIVLAYSNKGHTGFVGHSYLGRWVNLGAGTTTSNLKNTYGMVQLETAGGRLDTRQQFLGTFFGDHAKTGIGTMLTTGTILGAGANVFGTAQPPKRVKPFAWGEGEPYARYELEKFLAVAERMMERRHAQLSEKGKRSLTASYHEALKDAD